MDNYNMVLEAQKIALDSNGSATEKMTIWNESLEASQNRLTAAIQEFASNTDLDQLLIGATNLLTKIIELLDLVINKIPVLSQLLKGVLVAKGLTAVINSLDLINTTSHKALESMAGLQKFKDIFSSKNAVEKLQAVGEKFLFIDASASGMIPHLWGIVGAISAISLAVIALQKLDYITSLEYAKEKAQETAKQFDEESKAIEDISDKLESNKELIKSINKLDSPTLSDDMQLKLLQEENIELEKQLKTKKELAGTTIVPEEIKNAQMWLSRTRSTQDIHGNSWNEISRDEQEKYAKQHGFYTGSEYSARGLIYNLDDAEKHYSQYVKAQDENTPENKKALKERQEALQANIDAFNDKVNSGIKLTDEEAKLYSDYSQEMIDNIIKQGLNNEAANYVFSQENFDSSIVSGSSAIQELNKQMSEGMISEDIYKQKIREVAESIASDEQVKQALSKAFEFSPEEYGANFDKIVDYTISKLDTLESVFESISFDFPQLWENWNDQIDNIQSSFDGLTTAMEEYNTYGGLSADTLQTLLALDNDYINALSIENGQIAINADSIAQATQQRYEEAKAMVYEQALKDIRAVQDEQEIDNAASTSNALLGKAEVIANLTGAYGSLTEAIAKNAIVQQLAEDAGGGTFNEKQMQIAKAAQTKIGLLDQAAKNAGSSFKGLSNHLQGYTKSAKSAKDSTQELISSMKDAKSAISDLIDMTMNMLKQQYEDEKEVLDGQLEAFEKKINAQKEYLDLQQKELDHQKEIEEKNNNIANIQEQLTELEYDNSAEGQAKKLQLLDQLNKAQTELNDYQNDYETSSRQDALDKELESFKESIDKQKDYIDKVLLDGYNLYQEAIKLIEGRSIEFYNRLIQWNKVYGTHINEDVINAWNLAYEAMDKYANLGSGLQGIMEGLTSKIHELERATKSAADQAERYSRNMSGGSFGGSTPSNPSVSGGTTIKDSPMTNWRKQWTPYNTAGYNSRYEALSAMNSFGVKDSNQVKQAPDGKWYITRNKEVPTAGVHNGGHGGGNKFNSNSIQRFHDGTEYVTKQNSWLDKMLGLGSDETASIVKVGERIIPDYANVRNGITQDFTTNTHPYHTKSVSSESSLNVDVGDTIVSGANLDDIKYELEHAKQAYVKEIFRLIGKHVNIGGIKNQRMLAL